jgi:ActR/RegA family two-component response regulator
MSIIVISGYAGTGTIAAEARQAGCDVVLAKPCSLQTLLSVVASKSVDRRSGQPALS